MEKRSIAVLLVLTMTMVGLMSLPPFGATSGGSVAQVPGPSVGSAHASLPVALSPDLTPATITPQTTFPRTVLIETFTAEWCRYCPGESQALNQIEHTTNRSVLVVPELHVCGTPTACDDNYVAPDGTATTRSAYYNICGFPDVFFDGDHSTCGEVGGGTVAALQDIYNYQIANASAVPGTSRSSRAPRSRRAPSSSTRTSPQESPGSIMP